MKLKTSLWAAAALVCNLATAAPAAVTPRVAFSDQTTPRLVVKYRDAAPAERVMALSAEVTDRERAGAKRARFSLNRLSVMASGAVVYHLGQEVSLADARAAAARIAQDPSVEYAEPDVRVQTQQAGATSDPYSYVQWPLLARTGAAGGSNFAGAWLKSKGAGVLIGVIDTGGLFNHFDLVGQTLNGYDFVSADTGGTFNGAGDGDGRDYDATDPGNFCTAQTQTSDWHGTKVASMLVALANNGLGIAGAAPNAKVLQVRAIGRCGGFLSDVADALVWSVGAPVAGVATNTNPVQVANLSLGGSVGTACYTYMQDAINAATARNVPVVVAAGNEGLGAVGAPANCSGVIVVGAHTKSGDLASYSNYSTAVTLTAPGGGTCATQTTTCLSDPTVASGNNGTTVAGTDTPASYFSGTSAATPHVAAAIALIRAISPKLTPAEIKALLMATAQAHPAGTYCSSNPGACGAGMLDANAAVGAAVTPVLAIAASYTENFVAGSKPISLTATVTSGLGSTYTWTQVSGTPVTLNGANTATLSFQTPAVGGNLVFRANASTALGGALTLTQTVVVNNAPTLANAKFTVLSGSVLAGKLVGNDVDGDTVTFNLVDGPAGLTMQGDTLNWTAGVAGDFNVTIDMTDSRGATSRGTAVVTVTSSQTSSTSGTGTSSGSGSGGSSGGGGGGSMDLVLLGLLASSLLVFKRRKN